MNDAMAISQEGLELIRRFEGFSVSAYICPAGYKTIGYGHVILPSENHLLEEIDRQTAEALLKQDVNIFEHVIIQSVDVILAQHEFDALVSLAYNIGGQAFEKSTLLRYLNQGRRDKAAGEFGRWVYSKGRKLEGLVRRRAAEYQLFTGKT